jgi:hypothetical protein
LRSLDGETKVSKFYVPAYFNHFLEKKGRNYSRYCSRKDTREGNTGKKIQKGRNFGTQSINEPVCGQKTPKTICTQIISILKNIVSKLTL